MNVKALFVPLVALLLPLSAAAADIDHDSRRADFLAAEQALSDGNVGDYRKIKSRLTDYPLYQYLEYGEIRWSLAKTSSSRIERFLSDYPDTPLADLLRRAWLDQLAGKGAWRAYAAAYQPDDSTARQCNYLHALLQTGGRKEALAGVEPIWLHGKSQPRECDPVFDAWRNAGMLTSDLIWQRIELALEDKEVKLAKYLAKELPAPDRVWFDRWIDIYNSPAKVNDRGDFAAAHPWRETILTFGLERLAKGDAGAALDAWEGLAQRHSFSDRQRRNIEQAIGLRLIWQEQVGALEYLDRIAAGNRDQTLLEVGIREALAGRHWERVVTWVDLLPEDIAKQEGWRYWKARALAALGRGEESKAIYALAAKERSYYGFLAADRIGAPYNLSNIPLDPPAKVLQATVDLPGMQRTRELYRLGRMVEARREWYHLVKRLPNDDLKTVAKVLHDWGWHDRAIFTLARTDYWDDLELRFPIEHRNHVDHNAQVRALDHSWIFAVMRQESAFIQDARSPVGALGLMQLMPATARQVARSLNLKAPKEHEILQPRTNIQLGSTYLRNMLDEFGDHEVLATAAYNAGPHRVSRWLPEQRLDADIWVENIPFKETRGYVQRVLSYKVIYGKRLGQEPHRLAESMRPVQASEIRAASEEIAKATKGG